MYTIRSDDGTQIACRDWGKGSPVLLVHGIASDGSRWEPLLPMLTPRFQIYMMDRRGRGASGDTPPHAIEREFEDVAAVAASIGRPVALVGHGLGSLCALEAALRSSNVRKLVLFEPVANIGDAQLYSDGAIERIEQLLEQDRRNEAVSYFLREVTRVSPDELERIQRQIVWQRRIAAAPTIARELRAQSAYRFDPARLRTLSIPTLVLTGGNSPDLVKQQARLLADILPSATLVELPEQGCAAIDSAPGLFVREVVGFLRDTW
jgi:pimeloyl-ACP methyl ester carboxylesterase